MKDMKDPMAIIMDAYENPLSDEKIAEFSNEFLALVYGVLTQGMSEHEDTIIDLGLRVKQFEETLGTDHPALIEVNQCMDEITRMVKALRDKQKRVMAEITKRGVSQ